MSSTTASSSSPSPSLPRSVASSPPRPSPAVLREAAASLSSILPTPLPNSLLSDPTQALLLHDPAVVGQISALLHNPSSGSSDNPLCCWMYNTLQVTSSSSPPPLLPSSSATSRPSSSSTSPGPRPPRDSGPSSSLYTPTSSPHEQTSPLCVSRSRAYHIPSSTTRSQSSNAIAIPVSLGVLSPNLEPYGTVRSTRRARIVGMALELYFSQVLEMPGELKLCEAFLGSSPEDGASVATRSTKVTLQWEILQPMLRILGHCLMAPNKEKAVVEAAHRTCKGLHLTALHGVDAKAILAKGSLVELFMMKCDEEEHGMVDDPIEITSSILL